MPICTCNTSVFGTSASIMGSELQPPALRFAPAPCCRGFLMYRLAGSGVHKKHNTHQSTSGPLPCTIEAIIRSGTGTHPPARPDLFHPTSGNWNSPKFGCTIVHSPCPGGGGCSSEANFFNCFLLRVSLSGWGKTCTKNQDYVHVSRQRPATGSRGREGLPSPIKGQELRGRRETLKDEMSSTTD